MGSGKTEAGAPAIPSNPIIQHRGHPSRLPLRRAAVSLTLTANAVLTGPVRDASAVAERREWQAVHDRSVMIVTGPIT